MNEKDMKPVRNSITYFVTFYEEKAEPHTFGSNNISYEIYYENGIMSVSKIGAFGDRTLIGKFHDRRGRGITLKEMLENIEEISKMDYETFKKLIKEEVK
ncbi:MAG: hypothetical protein OSJ70_04890 [Bacilli bacterium]|nr:hypothetical protein [Bacilli bacterium]